MMLGVAAIMSVGLADAYFVGLLGARKLAAVGFIFPVTMALSSLGVGVIAGVSSVVSRALGAGDSQRAAGAANLGLALSLALGIAVATLLLGFGDGLFGLLQADAKMLPLIDAYMAPFALGFPLLMVMMAINGGLRGQGAARRAAAPLLVYAASNWALDPVLINGAFGIVPALGVRGAAIATVGGWLLGGGLAIVLMQGSDVRLDAAVLFRCDWKREIRALLSVAGPAAFSNSINPVGLSILTALLAREGNDAVAGFGAGGRVQSFAVVPLLGLSSSIGPIVGQNWGAEQVSRVRQALLLACGFCLGYGLLTALALVMAGERI
jgi:putative MATE family efflux protein